MLQEKKRMKETFKFLTGTCMHYKNYWTIGNIKPEGHMTIIPRGIEGSKRYSDSFKQWNGNWSTCTLRERYQTRGMMKGSLKPRLLAMVSTGLRQENMAANRMIFPMRGLTGRLARWYPRAVRFSSSSSALYGGMQGQQTQVSNAQRKDPV